MYVTPDDELKPLELRIRSWMERPPDTATKIDEDAEPDRGSLWPAVCTHLRVDYSE